MDRIRKHYDARASGERDVRAALRERALGPSAPLKKYHNSVKRYLIDTFARSASHLLDVGCGRGGDLHKWIHAGIRTVHGIDISEMELQEARRRFQNFQDKPPLFVCQFQCVETFGSAEWGRPGAYDVVSCMFALHYFWRDERTARQFLKNVSACLKRGGTFIGVVPDGREVARLLSATPKIDNPVFSLEKRWLGEVESFGSEYVCAIKDTVVTDDDHSEGSLEYLVFPAVLQRLAAEHGLRPIVEHDTPVLQRSRYLFKQFKPKFPSTCDPMLTTASSLFSAFVFVKV